MTVSSTARRRQGERLRLLPLQREVAPTAAALQGRAYPRRHRQGAADSIMAMVPAARPACNGSQSSPRQAKEQGAMSNEQGARSTREQRSKETPQHGLSSKTMALITSDCGATTLSLSIQRP